MANNTQDVEGYDVITKAIVDLLNLYPKLSSGDKIKFTELKENEGKAMFPISGSIIESESRDILGRRTQNCLYPFYVIYRVGNLTEARRQKVKEWLDDLGRWLEKQPITVGTGTAVLTEYPVMDSTQLRRKITAIVRNSPSTLNNISENNVEDWIISITVKYRNEY